MSNLPPSDKPVVMTTDDIVDLTKRVAALRAENERLRAALNGKRKALKTVLHWWLSDLDTALAPQPAREPQ